jgi:hypothetical protein
VVAVSDFLVNDREGMRTLAVLPTIAEDLPEQIREGLARRRLLAAGQPCPCGARPTTFNRAMRRAIEARRRKGLPGPVIHVTIEHEDDCPATDENLAEVAAEHGVDLRWWA